jgi:hypothetical protein
LGRQLKTLGLAAVLAAALGACGGPAPHAACPDDSLDACPTPAPTFRADAAPVIAARCAKCHVPGGMAKALPFQSYAEIAPFAGDMKLQLETCQMPKAPEPPLSAAERQILFGWIACGALDN